MIRLKNFIDNKLASPLYLIATDDLPKARLEFKLRPLGPFEENVIFLGRQLSETIWKKS